MCRVYHGYYCIDYEIAGGRSCAPPERKEVTFDAVNFTGSVKWVLDVECGSHDHFISLSDEASTSTASLRKRIPLPPAYWKRDSGCPTAAQSRWVFLADVSIQAPSKFRTSLDGTVKVIPRVNPHDRTALSIVGVEASEHEFNPPLTRD